MKSKNIITLAIITLVTALGWVLFDAYHAYVATTVTSALEKISLPLTPQIETKVIEKLKSRHAQ
ncbi:MAG: hypothetical protein AAB506_00440 [Patescibacteria group bacterium]